MNDFNQGPVIGVMSIPQLGGSRITHPIEHHLATSMLSN
jgi:hypothetical protein